MGWTAEQFQFVIIALLAMIFFSTISAIFLLYFYKRMNTEVTKIKRQLDEYAQIIQKNQ